jgi:hypothetical protein
MKILCLHQSYQTLAVEEQVSAHEIDPLRNYRHQVLFDQGIPAVLTLPLGAA